MTIPFLSLKDVTALHGAEINEAVSRVVNSGWYLQEQENARFEKNYAAFIGPAITIEEAAEVTNVINGYD